MNWEMICDTHDEARTALHKAARADNGALMRDYSWLRYALQEDDFRFYPTKDGFHVHGVTFTCQTQSNESFDFDIPMEAFNKFYEEA